MIRCYWDLCIARCPTCNSQSAQGLSALQSASIRNLPGRTFAIASGVRSLDYEGPRMASKVPPDATEGCVLRRFWR
eukprot:9489332-Alexandrium_andersonii.AAC.1